MIGLSPHEACCWSLPHHYRIFSQRVSLVFTKEMVFCLFFISLKPWGDGIEIRILWDRRRPFSMGKMYDERPVLHELELQCNQEALYARCRHVKWIEIVWSKFYAWIFMLDFACSYRNTDSVLIVSEHFLPKFFERQEICSWKFTWVSWGRLCAAPKQRYLFHKNKSLDINSLRNSNWRFYSCSHGHLQITKR